jgi:Activator of Hsp90 ATPase homolog 1-like protein
MTKDEYGTVERVGDVSILRFRRRLEHPPDLVWAALTENEHLEGWFPTTIEGVRVAGGALHFSFREGDGSGCLLTLTVAFPEYGKAARDAAGWHVCLEQLAFVCASASLPWAPPERWREVHPRYVERLGPEASAIGPPAEWERVKGDASSAG